MRFPHVLFLALLLLAAPAHARQAADARPQTASSISLDSALLQLAWDVSRDGALLIVDPRNTRPTPPAVRPGTTPTAPPNLPPAPPDGYRLSTLAPLFERRVVPVRSLTVLAPTMMVTLNPRPGKADPMAGLRRDEVMRYFAASLTPEQWRKIGSTEGLGIGDMDATQRDLFMHILPNPLRVVKTVTPPPGTSAANPTRSSYVNLTDAQRGNIRIRLSRAINWLFHTQSAPGQTGNLFINKMPTPAETSGGESYSVLDLTDVNRNDAFGQTLRQVVPARLKPSDLDFDASGLDTLVSLVPESDGVLTIGELVRRTATATGAELYTDGRVARLPVWVRGERARAGDLLKALCLAVTGTIRRVVSEEKAAYILADDREGIGTRTARIAEWHEAARALKAARDAELLKRFESVQPLQYLDYPADDPIATQPQMRKRLESSRASYGMFGAGPEIALGELPLPVQTAMREQMNRISKSPLGGGQQDNRAFEIDKVRLETRTRVSYVIPDVGEVDAPNLLFEPFSIPYVPVSVPTPPGDGAPVPPPVLPDSPIRAVVVAPKSAEEARRAARVAKAKGLTQLWVALEYGVFAKEILNAAIAAGKENGLAIQAVVSLMRSGVGAGTSNTLPASAQDLNILGEPNSVYAPRRRNLTTGPPVIIPVAPPDTDWLRPDTAESKTRLTTWLTDLARTPGLAGLVLRDTSAPGYSTRDGAGGLNIFAAANDFGYTPEMRLAFLRQEGFDPVDLGGGTVAELDLTLPFFPGTGPQRFATLEDSATPNPAIAALQKWNTFRYRSGAILLAELYAALRAVRSDLPLLLAPRPVPNFSTGSQTWFGSWDAPERLPYPIPPSGETRTPLSQQARSFSRQVLLSLPYPSPMGQAPQALTATDYARHLGPLLRQNQNGWDGIVLDLSQVPTDQALALVESLPASGVRTADGTP
jgi:hypothetical protein